jgi:hypothetical protein
VKVVVPLAAAGATKTTAGPGTENQRGVSVLGHSGQTRKQGPLHGQQKSPILVQILAQSLAVAMT